MSGGSGASPPRDRWRGLKLALPLALGVIVGQAASPLLAVATNFGGPLDAWKACDSNLSSQCVAENYTHRIYYDSSLTQPYRDAVNAIIPVYDATDMSVATEAYGTTNDVRVSGGYWGQNGAWAWTACANAPTSKGTRPADGHNHGHNWCKPQIFRWNLDYSANYNTPDKRKAIACHEVGHTMGLRHSGDPASCMKDPPTLTTPPAMAPTSSHDVPRINEHYP